MAAFATAADLATRLGITLTTDEQTRADALLARASGLVRETAKQTIALVEDDVLTMRGTNDERLLLPERPVVSVSSVTVEGVPVAFYQDGNELVRDGFTADGLLLDVALGRGFGHPSQELTVTYTHGYADDELPETVVSIVLEAVVRVWVNPGAVIGERHGSEQVQYLNGQPTGLLLTTGEQRAIRRLFGRRLGSVSQS